MLAGTLVAILALGVATPATAEPACIAVIADSDLHGAIEPHARRAGGRELHYGGLLAQSAYVSLLRRHYGSRMVLVSSGDLYQGTLASNLSRGRAAVAAYNLLGYAATAVGNHDFDYGPRTPTDRDRLGVLKDRVAQATFPFLTTNVFTKATHQRVRWPGSQSTVLVDAGGIRAGIIGVATVETPQVTRRVNVAALEFRDPVALVVAAARRLRSAGADVIIVTTHLGAKCHELDDPHDTSSCEPNSELFALLEALPPGTAEIAIGGHTHSYVGHFINQTIAIQAGARGQDLGWADVCLAPGGGLDAIHSEIHPPLRLCLDEWDDPRGGCGYRRRPTPVRPATFLGSKVIPMPAMAPLLAPYLAAARDQVRAPIHVRLPEPLARNSGKIWLGTLVAEALRRASGADFGVQNLGGVRSDLPAGELTFGQAYEVLPFGNQIAVLHLSGAQVRAFVQQLISRRAAPPYLAGLRAVAGDDGYRIERSDGAPLEDAVPYTLATSDFLEGGGEGLDEVLAAVPPEDRNIIDTTLRDAFIDLLARRFPG